MALVMATPCVSASMASIFFITASVRCSEAASGSCTFTMKKPWYSSGRKLPGIRAPSSTTSAVMPPRMAALRTSFRTSTADQPT